MADILADGSSNFHYRGLGDRIFAMVFRRIYGSEIERVSVRSIEDDFKQQLAGLKGQLSVYRGAVAEYRVRYRLLAASLSGATVGDIVQAGRRDLRALPLGPFTTIRKARFYSSQDQSVEVDLHAACQDDAGTDLMIEVKDWQGDVTRDAVRRFVEVKAALAGRLERKTVFLFYSESGLSEKLAAMLTAAGILIIDAAKLATCEAPAGL